MTACQLGNGILLGMNNLGFGYQIDSAHGLMYFMLAVIVPACWSTIISNTYNSVIFDDYCTNLETTSMTEFSVPGCNIQVSLEYICFQRFFPI
jgi:hypothetical protein